MIPTKPPPSFRNPDKWSPEFIDFVSKCLVKNPEQRAMAGDLLKVRLCIRIVSTSLFLSLPLKILLLDMKIFLYTRKYPLSVSYYLISYHENNYVIASFNTF